MGKKKSRGVSFSCGYITASHVIILLLIIILAALAGLYYFQGIGMNTPMKKGHASHDMSQSNQAGAIPGYSSSVYIDPERTQLLGLSVEEVVPRYLTKKIRTVGVVQIDETRVAHVQTKFSGWIEKLYVDFVGMPVTVGQSLFSVYSPELFATQQEYLIALKDVERESQGMFAQDFNRFSLDMLQAVRERLLLWDISPEQIAALEQCKAPHKTLLFRSPIHGIVLDKTAFIGMNVHPGIMLYTIADLSRVWVLADVYENDIAFVKVGQKGTITTPSLPGHMFSGSVTFVDYVMEAGTRTAKIRFECENSNFILKPEMYATAELEVEMGKALALPEEAVIDTGERKVVFTDKGEGHYEPREVQLGYKAGRYYQVLAGIHQNERVVTSSQFLLDSESRIKVLAMGGMKGHGTQ